jgi:protein-tyrosine-phosphatase/predicted ATP-grasp superfamily ATP-dependent carboligase
MGSRCQCIPGKPILIALVLDAGSRAAIETIHSMARHGVEVDAAADNDCLAFKSKRVRRCLHQPAAADTDNFLEWLRKHDQELGYSLIVPSTEISLRHFLCLPESDPLRQKAVLASNGSLRVALDKSLTLDLCAKLNIPVPNSNLIGPGREVPACNSYPAVLKPVSSVVYRDGFLKQLRACVVRSEFERCEVLAEMLVDSAVLQQEFVPGHGVGIEMLYRHGQPVWYFCHERLHEGTGQPGLGGGSSYRRSIAPKGQLLCHAVALLNALQWHGVAMVEFRVEENGSFWLMEINPRLWGSVALAIDAGVDFPFGLLCVATSSELAPQPDYTVGYSTRLLWQDIGWLGHRILYRMDRYAVMEMLKLLKPIVGNESWDYFDWGDLGVTIADFRAFVSGKLRSVRNKIAKRWERKGARKIHNANLHRILSSTDRPRKALFLCHGNICRSPVSKLMLETRFGSFEASSAGFYSRTGRSSPPHIQRLAKAFAVDVSSHLSKLVTRDMVSAADVVFLYDMANFEHFCKEFPESTNKVLFLGMFSQPRSFEIRDPYDLKEADAVKVLEQISKAIDGVGARL